MYSSVYVLGRHDIQPEMTLAFSTLLLGHVLATALLGTSVVGILGYVGRRCQSARNDSSSGPG